MGTFLRDYKRWLWLAGVLFTIVIIGPISNRIWGWSHVWPWALIALVVAILVAWQLRRREQARVLMAERARAHREQEQQTEAFREQFALCKPADEMRPSDFGFQVVDPGEEADLRFRPFYPTYVPRLIVPIDEVATDQPRLTYTEAALRAGLAAGCGFVLHGPPTMGKSRTVYEVLAGLESWTVVSPRRDRPTPPPDAFAALVAGQHVVLLLEDLNDYAGAAVDLATFCGADGLGKAERWAVAATCRDGPELGAVKDARSRSLRRFYDEIPLKLTLLPQSSEEKRVLAKSAGRRNWDAKFADDFPTPGTIVMEDALVFMRGRFDDLPGDRRDVLRAVKLLLEAGVLPVLHIRVQAAVETVFKRSIPQLTDCLRDLADQAFLHQPGEQDPILPEPAYLQDRVVRYAHDRRPRDDIRQLLGALMEIEDAYGAAMIGYTYAVTMNDHALALEAYDVALALRPGDPFILVNRAASLYALGRFDEALGDAEAALRQDRTIPTAFVNRGAALGALGHHEEALADLEEALELGGQSPEIAISRVSALKALGQHHEALEAINGVLRAAPGHPGALSVRGGLLVELGRGEEALQDLDDSLRLRPGNAKTSYNRGLALARLSKPAEALEAFDLALKSTDESSLSHQERFLATYHRAMALVALGCNEEALTGFDAALELSPGDAPTLYNRGVTLCDIGKYEEALADFSAALAARPDDASYLNARDYAVSKLGHDA